VENTLVLVNPGKGFRGLLSADSSSEKLLLSKLFWSQLSKMETPSATAHQSLPETPLKFFLDPLPDF